MGFKTIENQWKEYTGLANALQLDYMLFKYGDEIISTPLTFVSCNQYLLMLMNFCVKRKITSRTKAIIFVGLGGSTGQLEICKDAAHMAGTK